MPINDFELELNIELISKDGKPAIQLRKCIMRPDTVAKLMEQAMNEKFVLAKIVFKDKIKAIVKLREAGLIE